MKRGSAAFHWWDSFDARFVPALPLFIADGWLIEARRQSGNVGPLVLQIVTTLAAGGAERLVHDITMRLPHEGFRAEAVTIFGSGQLEGLFRTSGTPLTVFPRSNWFTAFRSVRELIRRKRPAIVHTHLFGADVLGRIAAFFAHVPVIITTEHNVNVDHGWLKRFTKRILALTTTAFIAISKTVKQFMVEKEGTPEEKIHIIPNGIDLSRVVPRMPGPFHDIPRLITVGRLAQQKGHVTLLKALALIKRPWQLDIIGEGELEHPLKELAERLGIAPRIRWLGYRDDVSERLAESDLFCFPSRWEGLGLAFLEAAAAGVPIVASDLPVFREIASSERVAYVPSGDVPAWAHAIESRMADPVLAVRHAYEGSLEIHQRFSIERMVSAYATLYRTLLKPTRRT
jgi:glycosyltransferase involved in cell wall biosynthesis